MKMKGKIKLFLFLIFLLLLNLPSFSNDAMNSNSEPSKIVKGNNCFCFKFYSDLARKEKGNLLFSPFSVYTAFAMVYEGASGKTKEEMETVFNFVKEGSGRRGPWAKLLDRINKKGKDYQLFTANALWIQKDFKVLPDYTTTIEKFYKGMVSNIDFFGATERSRQTINKWVEEKTTNKIKELFRPGTLNQLTRLVLTNAIYFKGEWLKQFEKEDTKEEDFWVSKERSVKVPMMRITGQNARFNYAETEGLQILEMDYKGNDISMIVLLPKGDIELLEKSLTEENLRNWISRLREERIDVYFPKFKITKRYTLNDIVQEMGAKSAFIPGKADFSKINGTKELYIQIAVHQAFIEVNEEGTEAGGATGIGIGITAVPIKKVFRADHPFIFIIQEKETETILFLGKVVNPKE